MKKIVLMMSCLMMLVNTTAFAKQKQVNIEVESQVTHVRATQYTTREPYVRIKETYLEPGQKEKFTFAWDTRDSPILERNVTIYWGTSGTRLCNLYVYTDGYAVIENFWYPDLPHLNHYQCDRNITTEGYHVVIKNH